jgi:predicted DNA-binding ribbon-helix-helix protein
MVLLKLMKDKVKRNLKRKKKLIKTTLYLEEDLWKQLKHEAIDKKTTLSELINRKLKELETLKKKTPLWKSIPITFK